MDGVVYCRFRSHKEGSTLPVDGPAISLRDLKKAVFQAKNLYKGLDHDLRVWDAATDKEIEDEDQWILAGSSVVMSRVPLPIRSMQKGKKYFEREIPRPGYICERCNVPGHYIKDCKTNGDPNFAPKKLKTPRGIPKWMLVENPYGSYVLPTGVAAVIKPNEAAFEKEIEGLPSTRPAIVLPQEWICPLCNKGMGDAVLTSKCCFKSFCDGCIRYYIITKSVCFCGARNILADDLVPNRTLREAISRMVESGSSSSGSSGITSSTLSASSTCEPKKPAIVKCSSDIKKGEAAAKGQPLCIMLRKRKTTDTVQSKTMLEPALDSEQDYHKRRKKSTFGL